MADVRALLRSERASRKLNHPHAVYSSSGLLSCSICRVTVKSETLWDAHIQLSQHVSMSQNVKNTAKDASLGGRKRKAGADDDSERKKSRNEEEAAQPAIASQEKFASIHTPLETIDEVFQPTDDSSLASATAGPVVAEIPVATNGGDVVDEEEWAAFERDVATPPPEPSHKSAITAPASIQAQPLTAAELSAQNKESEGSGRGRREAELEAEKEEASRQLEDEFDEMEALEQRVRKLRDQREALRNAAPKSAASIDSRSIAQPVRGAAEASANQELDEGSGDDSGEDDTEGWGFPNI